MDPEIDETKSTQLRPEQVSHYSTFFQDQLCKKILRKNHKAVSLINEVQEEGQEDFIDKTKGWNYKIERTRALSGGEVTVSITRFPVDLSSPIISEGMRFIIRNYTLTTEPSIIEYHI